MSIQASHINSEIPIWPTLTKLYRTLGISSEQMAELLQLTRSEYQKYSKAKKQLPAGALLKLSRELHISFEDLMTNNFCYRSVAQHYHGDKSNIPEKYTLSGKSKRRVLANILDFVEIASDYQRRLELMRHLQVNESALKDEEGTINLRCTMEAVAWLGHYSGNDLLLMKLGREMLLTRQNQKIFEPLEKCGSIYELFDALFFENGILYKHFEKNFLWKIVKIIPGEKIFVDGLLDEEVKESIDDSVVRSRGGRLGRVGMCSAFSELGGWEPIPVSVTFLPEKKTVCRLEFDISNLIRSTPKTQFGLITRS